jgi:hypothetical protein
MEWISRDKRSSLFCVIVSDDEKRFRTLTPGGNVIKLFFFIADDEAK